MTRKGEIQLPARARKIMARLMHLHYQTHPDRIGKRFKVGGKYVGQVWRQMSNDEMASLEEALKELECQS